MASPTAPPQHREGHGQASVLVHSPHRHGDPKRAGEEDHPERHLPVHHGEVSLLSGEQAGLAELHQAQPEPERVFCQGAQRRQETWQGQLLDAGSRLVQYVRQRIVPSTQEAIQEERRRQGEGRADEEAAGTERLTHCSHQERREGRGGREQEQTGMQAETRTNHRTESLHECEV